MPLSTPLGRALRHDLQLLDPARPVRAWIGERLRVALGVEVAGTYAVQEGERGIEIAACAFSSTASGEGEELSRRFVGFCARRGTLLGTFDPLAVARSQRDRVVLTPSTSSLVTRRRPWGALRPQDYPIVQEALDVIFRPLDLDVPQARALICDGPRLLAWVGLLMRRPRPAAVASFRSILPAIRARFLVEQRLAAADLASGAMAAALDALPTAAFLITVGRHVAHANRLGRAWIDQDPRGARAALLSRRGPDAARFEVTRLAGVDGHVLAMLRAAPDEASPRVAVAARHWRLTPREADVLRWLTRGASNGRIAAELGCAERTVEIHVGRILAKADAESRGEVIARVWSGASLPP
jgi:DNA-binding CsgD family transcriptional regulator